MESSSGRTPARSSSRNVRSTTTSTCAARLEARSCARRRAERKDAMPGEPHHCLNTVHYIYGVDIHTQIPPLPFPMGPHSVVWQVGRSHWMALPLVSSTTKACIPEKGGNGIGPPNGIFMDRGHAAGRRHDSGPHPSHIAPNLL